MCQRNHGMKPYTIVGAIALLGAAACAVAAGQAVMSPAAAPLPAPKMVLIGIPEDQGIFAAPSHQLEFD